jgi:hypothetical protein
MIERNDEQNLKAEVKTATDKIQQSKINAYPMNLTTRQTTRKI